MHFRKIFLLTVFSSTIFFSCRKDKVIPDITTGIVASFSLNGNAVDSVNNISGTIHSVVATKNRFNQENTAMKFSSTDSSFIDFGDHANYSFTSNEFTINCWVKVEDTISSGAILSKRGSFGPFEYSLDNHFAHAVFNLDNWSPDGNGSVYGADPLKSSATMKLNSWQMITYVADGSSLKVYADGVLNSEVDSHNATKFFGDTDAPLTLGVGGGFGVNYYFSGSIDDVKFFNRALTEEQVKYLFQK